MGPELILETLISLLRILEPIIGQQKAQAVLSLEEAVRANALADIEETMKFGLGAFSLPGSTQPSQE